MMMMNSVPVTCGYAHYVPAKDAIANANTEGGVWYSVWKCAPYHPAWLGMTSSEAAAVLILGVLFLGALLTVLLVGLLDAVKKGKLALALPKPYLWKVRREQMAAADPGLARRLADLREMRALQKELGL
jgi:hypothetical protein